MFNLDPKKMQAVMKQMGISQENIPASRVIIEKEDGGKILISEPSVARVKMQGQESFQITGNISEQNEDFSEKDIKAVMEQAGCTKMQAKQALEKTGDLVEAIMLLGE